MSSNQNPQSVLDVSETKVADPVKATSLSAWCSAQWRPIMAELISTSMLVLFGCMSCIPIEGVINPSPLYAPLGFGMTVMFNIQIFGHISGAHMNPTVTLAAILWGNMSIATGIAYFIAQILGAIFGYGILFAFSPVDLPLQGICVTLPHTALSEFQAFGVEAFLTGTLVFLCCGLWDPVNGEKQDSVPIKFGLAIFGLSIIGGPLTDASMNPARTLGPALWTGIWTSHWVYWAGPFLGSVVTSVFYKMVFLKRTPK